MRKPGSALWPVVLFVTVGWTTPAAGYDNPERSGGEIRIKAHEFTYAADGTPSKDQSYGQATVGYDFEFSRQGQTNRVRFGRPLVPSAQGHSLMARTELKPDQAILFRLEWRENGRLIRTEEVVSRGLAGVTRTFFVEPETGVRHVVQFAPYPPGDEKESFTEVQRVDRMRLNPGAIPGPFLRDGKLVALIRGFGDGFEKLYINLPGTGFFQFSLHPFPGSEPAGKLEGAVVAFEWRGSKYQWFLGSSPLPEGTWTVFLKGTDEIPPEYRDAIRPEFAGEIVVGGSNGRP